MAVTRKEKRLIFPSDSYHYIYICESLVNDNYLARKNGSKESNEKGSCVRLFWDSMSPLMKKLDIYPLVNIKKKRWKITIFKFGKSTKNEQFPIAMLVYQRVDDVRFYVIVL
jgi:hypothetical protein